MRHPVSVCRERTRRAGARPPDGERGETLVELLVTIVLLGLLFTAILAALFTATSTATLNREKTLVSVFLQKWAETTLAPATPGGYVPNYQDCNTPVSGIPAAPDGWTVSWSSRYAVATGSPPQVNWDNPAWQSQSACFSTGDKGLQEITLRVATRPGQRQVVDSLVVVKRNPKCPPSFDNADLGPC